MKLEIINQSGDDTGFVNILQRILFYFLQKRMPAKVFLVQVEDWFESDWLSYSGHTNDPKNRRPVLPPFAQNYVTNEQHFGDQSGGSLHGLQPYSKTSNRELSDIANDALYVWYSGGSQTNKRASIMLYYWADNQFAVEPLYLDLKVKDRWRTVQSIGCDHAFINSILS